jgi:putative phosphoribosyl transferase
VPVAAEVAHALGAPLDVLITLKMGPPGKPEVAAGAMAAGGVRVENRDIIESLAIPQGEVEAMSAHAFADLAAREAELRGQRGAPKLEGRTVVLIDEGIAGSALPLAALSSARAQGAARVIVAAPVGAAPAVDELGREADQVVCAAVAEQFFTISPFYEEFADVSVEQARRILERAWSEGLEPEREVAVGGL